LSLSGHESTITSVAISEHQGFIVSVSSCKKNRINTVLVHSFVEGKYLNHLFLTKNDDTTTDDDGKNYYEVSLTDISNSSGKIVLYSADTNKLFLFDSLRSKFPMAKVTAQEIYYDIKFTKEKKSLNSDEMLILAGEHGIVTLRVLDKNLSIVASFQTFQPTFNPANHINAKSKCLPSLLTLSLNDSEEAILTGAEDGTISLLPLPPFQSHGSYVNIPLIGIMDVKAKIASAKNTVLKTIETHKVLETARGVATEVGSIGKRFFSVFTNQ